MTDAPSSSTLSIVAVNSGFLGLLTVAILYFVTHSGLLLLISAGVGLLLAVLGGGIAGSTSASGAEHAGNAIAGMMVEDMGLWPQSYTDASFRGILLFYGAGVFLWSLIILFTLRDTLV